MLRKFRESDFEKFHLMQSDIKVMQYTTMRALSEAENREQFQDILNGYDEPDRELWVWSVEHEKEGFIGTAAFVYIAEGTWEIGYRLLHEFWGRGFASEITSGMINWAKKQDKMSEIIAVADIRNTASIKVLEKCGFTFQEKKINDEMQCIDLHFKILLK